MPGLFDPIRHERLTTTPWSAAAAREAIQRVANAAQNEFDAARGSWRTHPLDEPRHPDERHADLYLGAGGVIWALRDLAAQGAIDAGFPQDCAGWLPELPRRVEAQLAGYMHGDASYLCGSSGLLLLQWIAQRSRDTAERLFAKVQSNLRNPALEPLWGSPGSVQAAIHMAEATGEMRWMRLVQEAAAILLEQMTPDPDTGNWMWVQDLYGRRIRYLGAGHGFAGNVYPALRGAALLDATTVETYCERAWRMLSATALRADAQVNWPPMADAEMLAKAQADGRLPLVQDCHGAPGIVCRLATVPRTPDWDDLLRGAGELTWAAGPLVKGASLCHGTGGSAMAMLKLWRRLREPLWLERARRLAMHMIEQLERHRVQYGQGRHSLWTGDLGAACVLWNCIVEDDRFPTLDHI